jgi:hypothetical protein
MNFELTISGLCATVLKSKESKPKHPEAIDIILPKACHHVGRLSYLPTEVTPPDKKYGIEPELVVDAVGGRIASFNMDDQALQFSFQTNPHARFDVNWGEDTETPSTPWEEMQLNWLPKLHDLGFGGFTVGAPGTLPHGARARITLPYGALSTREMIRKPVTNQCLRWDFPATGLRRSLANEVVFTADRVDSLSIKDQRGTEILRSTLGQTRTLRMCISNDMENVPRDYNNPEPRLDHLRHLDVLATSGSFQEPKVVNNERTGHPICMGVVFIDCD